MVISLFYIIGILLGFYIGKSSMSQTSLILVGAVSMIVAYLCGRFDKRISR